MAMSPRAKRLASAAKLQKARERVVSIAKKHKLQWGKAGCRPGICLQCDLSRAVDAVIKLEPKP